MQDAQRTILQAILLLGPTGAGKTPLGDWLEKNGLWGQSCHHFDFGANLRAVVAAGPSDSFASDEIHFLQRVLAQGALLEKESLGLAANILDGFIARRNVQPEQWFILNGLPCRNGCAVMPAATVPRAPTTKMNSCLTSSPSTRSAHGLWWRIIANGARG